MAAGATRGQPSGGVGPYRQDYDLGNDPDWLKKFGEQGQSLDQQAQSVGAQGQGWGMSLGGQALQQGYDRAAAAGYAANRYAPQTSYDPTLAKVQGTNVTGGGQQYALADQLKSFAAQPEGPSAAQAQLQKGTDAALAANLAAARSGSGFGDSSNALEAAGANSAATIANAANDAATLRANETANYRNQQLQALGASGQQLAAARGADLGLAQQVAQQGQFGTSTALQQTGLNDQAAANLYNQQLQAGQLALQDYGMGQSAAENALGFQQQGQNQQLQAAQAQQQGTMGYEGDLNDIYQTDMTHNIQSRQLDQQRDKDRVTGVSSVIGSIAGAIFSDRRTKRRIRDADLDQKFRDLADEDESRSPRIRAGELSDLYSGLAA